jgi:hypothetical protein
MIVAVFGQISGVILIVSLINAVVRSRRGGSTALPAADLRRVESRLSDMQDAIDAVAVEIERISEGQRFTTRLLAERGEISVDAVNGTRAGRGSASR